jgi:hypothetical protein
MVVVEGGWFHDQWFRIKHLAAGSALSVDHHDEVHNCASTFASATAISPSTWRFHAATRIEGGWFNSGGSDWGCVVPRRFPDVYLVYIDLLDAVQASAGIFDADLLCSTVTAPEDLHGSPTNAASSTL